MTIEKTTHTLCERIKIFLSSPTMDTLKGIFRNYYVHTTEERRNEILNKEKPITPNVPVGNRTIDLAHLNSDEGASFDNYEEASLDNHEEASLDNDEEVSLDNHEEVSLDNHEEVSLDNDEEVSLDNHEEVSLDSDKEKISKINTEEKPNVNHQVHGEDASDKNTSGSIQGKPPKSAENNINNQTEQEVLEPQVLITKSKYNRIYTLSPSLVKSEPAFVAAESRNKDFCYYSVNKNENKFKATIATQQWKDEQRDMEYQIKSNDEVETTLKDNKQFAQQQEQEQEQKTVDMTYPQEQLGFTVHSYESAKNQGVAVTKGQRSKMEDSYLECKPCYDHNMFGVFDGHDGSGVSNKLAKDFHVEIERQLTSWLTTDVSYIDKDGKKVTMNKQACCFNALTMAHVNFDKSIDYSRIRGGSTSVTTNLIDGNLYISNLGDSRAILIGPNGAIVQLTEDAKLMTKVKSSGNSVLYKENKYTEGVIARGGKIEGLANGELTLNSDYLPRVNNVLAVPKSMGDKSLCPNMSDSNNDDYDTIISCVNTVAISARPDITMIEKPENGWDGYTMVLCCDGLTDVLTTQNIGEYVHKRITQNPNGSYKDIAAELVNIGLNQNSTDNITVLLFDVNEMKQQSTTKTNE